MLLASTMASATETGHSTAGDCSEAPICVGVRTNMLYDVMAAPTIGVECCISRVWSIALDGTYTWLNNKDKSRVWRIEGLSLSGRRYFGERPFAGWHAGLYGQLLRYDIHLGSKGYLSGGSGTRGKPSYGFGVEGGYTLALSRRLRIDFSLGLGYLGGEYQVYRRNGIHNVWQSTHTRKYFGPTSASISLVWVIGKGGCQ